MGNRPPRNKKIANPGGYARGGGGMVIGGIEQYIKQEAVKESENYPHMYV